ncbi:MAG: bifunctional diaminohydroxyphosphoribosylaminopyrimidine deaminase/5-amino-6-(5-phosphoribosylamino)uracil reductase RibD [Bacteroidales bacterium]
MRKEEKELYMRRCLELASLGRGNTYPNPVVGSVLVADGRIIGEGFHRKAGCSHAEVVAIDQVQDKALLRRATLFVNLEPCSHYGKTPPCAERIVREGIPHVIIGTRDTSSKVAGKGIAILKANGVKVEEGILAEASRKLNAAFFTYQEKKQPQLVLKWAQTLDGFIDYERSINEAPEIHWITNELAKTVVHKWRSEFQAILVGANTVINDNPRLTVRNWYGKNPLRVVLDPDCRVSYGAHVFDSAAETLYITDLRQKGQFPELPKVVTHYIDFGEPIGAQLFAIFYKLGVQTCIVEGGAQTLQYFLDEDLWDEIHLWIGERFFYQGLKAPVLNSKSTTKELRFGQSTLVVHTK